MEADADVRPEVSVDEIEAAMREGGSIGGGAGVGSANGSLRVEVRASRRAPQPPKAGVNGSATAEAAKQTNGTGEQPKSPTSDGERRRRRKEEPAEGEIDVRAVMPQSTFKFRRAVRPEDPLEKEKEKVVVKELPPLGREETL